MGDESICFQSSDLLLVWRGVAGGAGCTVIIGPDCRNSENRWERSAKCSKEAVVLSGREIDARGNLFLRVD
jgi:hypothetical protein